MKVTKEQSLQNRQALLDAAGRLFKQHGLDGIGVADVCREAGLTHGALYKHFADKQDLAAQAFAHAFRQGHERMGRAAPQAERSFGKYLDHYLNRRVRDDLAAGCPLVATACETARQTEPVSRSFADAFVALRDGVASSWPEQGASAEREALATVCVAALVGAMAISRGVVKADRALADAVLDQAHAALASLLGERAAPPSSANIGKGKPRAQPAARPGRKPTAR